MSPRVRAAQSASRFTKPTFERADLYVEASIPQHATRALIELGREVKVVPPRNGIFGYGQAVVEQWRRGAQRSRGTTRGDSGGASKSLPATKKYCESSFKLSFKF